MRKNMLLDVKTYYLVQELTFRCKNIALDVKTNVLIGENILLNVKKTYY